MQLIVLYCRVGFTHRFFHHEGHEINEDLVLAFFKFIQFIYGLSFSIFN